MLFNGLLNKYDVFAVVCVMMVAETEAGTYSCEIELNCIDCSFCGLNCIQI